MTRLRRAPAQLRSRRGGSRPKGDGRTGGADGGHCWNALSSWRATLPAPREPKTRCSIPGQGSRRHWLPVPDWDHLRSAAFVTATTAVGFLIWILFDPPGHSGWFQLSGTIRPYWSPSSRSQGQHADCACGGDLGDLPGDLCLRHAAAVKLPRPRVVAVHYHVSGLLFPLRAWRDSSQHGDPEHPSDPESPGVQLRTRWPTPTSFFVMVFAFLFVMSYLLSSPRPEKAVLHLLDRFFRSAEFLMSRKAANSGRVSRLERWRMRVSRAPIAFASGQARSLGQGH